MAPHVKQTAGRDSRAPAAAPAAQTRQRDPPNPMGGHPARHLSTRRTRGAGPRDRLKDVQPVGLQAAVDLNEKSLPRGFELTRPTDGATRQHMHAPRPDVRASRWRADARGRQAPVSCARVIHDLPLPFHNEIDPCAQRVPHPHQHLGGRHWAYCAITDTRHMCIMDDEVRRRTRYRSEATSSPPGPGGAPGSGSAC